MKPGTYTLTETPSASWTNTGVTCKDQGNVNVPISNGQVAVGPGQTVTCKFANVKKGQLTLNKQFIGGPASQRANLFIKQGGTVINAGGGQKLDAANGQGTGAQAVSPGTFDLSETAGTNTDFANYSSTWDCTKNGAAFIPSTPGIAGSVAVGAGENVVCTFHNSFNNFNPTVVTQASADVVLGADGSDLTDTATLSGGFSPTGTITFKLYNDATCTPGGLVGTVTKTVTGTAFTSHRRSMSMRRARITGSRTMVVTGTTTRPRTVVTARTRTWSCRRGRRPWPRRRRPT